MWGGSCVRREGGVSRNNVGDSKLCERWRLEEGNGEMLKEAA